MTVTTDVHPRQSTVQPALLDDGTVVTLRTLRADDRSVIRMLFEGLSDDSRYRRFHSPISRIAPVLLDTLSAMDGDSHVAVGAFDRDQLIGAARYVRPHGGSREAEIAFTVADAYQGRGLGRRLLHTLARTAYARGVIRFRFTVLANNTPAIRLLLGPEAPVGSAPWQRDGSVDVMDILVRSAAPMQHSSEWGQSKNFLHRS